MSKSRRTDGGPPQRLRLAVAALENQAADLRQRLAGRGIGVVVGRTAPDGLLVELEPLVLRIAEDHGAQPAVAQRQSLLPYPGRSVVMQFQIGFRSGGGRRDGQTRPQTTKISADFNTVHIYI